MRGYPIALMLAVAAWPAAATFDLLGESVTFGYLTGNQLYGAQRPEATMYVAGIIDGNARLDSGARGYCLPSGQTLGQVTDVALQYLRDHPATRHEPAAYLVRASLRLTFPCK